MQTNMMGITAFNLLDNEVITSKNFTFSSNTGMLIFTLPDLKVDFIYTAWNNKLIANYNNILQSINFSEDQQAFILKHIQTKIIAGYPTELEKFLLAKLEASKIKIDIYDRGKQENEGDN